MTTEYEHEGTTYHEPLPRVHLVGYANSVREKLVDNTHNVKLVSIREEGTPPVLNWSTQAPPHEVDILLIRDRAEIRHSSYQIPISMGGPLTRTTRTQIQFSGTIIWPSDYRDNIGAFCGKILDRGGACVFFVADPHGNVLAGAGLGIWPMPEKKLWPGRSSYRAPVPPGFESLAPFAERYLSDAPLYVGIGSDPAVQWVPLLEDSASVPYVVVRLVKGPTNPKQGLVLCLPDYGERADVLNELLSNVLPELLPHLFPFRHDLSWLKNPEFRNPKVATMEAEKEAIEHETQLRLAELEKEINALDDNEAFLRNLLTTDGDLLKKAVKQALEALLIAAEAVDAQVVDVDPDPSLRHGSSDKREDLRVEWKGKFILVNVAGREREFRPNSLNQLDKHKRRFLKSNSVNAEDVHSLLIGNFNYKGGLDPRRRGDMFGTGTAEAQERLVNAGYGAMGTFDLYRLIRCLQRAEIAMNAADLLRLLTSEGLLDFEAFKASLPKSRPPESATEGQP